jgi:hypothetical protein
MGKQSQRGVSVGTRSADTHSRFRENRVGSTGEQKLDDWEVALLHSCE